MCRHCPTNREKRMYAKSTEKREQILEGAKGVFLQKGFAAASMQDIIQACGISRGGLYFYYSSVGEIFCELITGRARTTQKMVQHMIENSTSFENLLREYFAYQKERLCNMDKSLLGAMVQYGLANETGEGRRFVQEQYEKTRLLVESILAHGRALGQFSGDVQAAASHILFVIEGMSIMAMTAGMQVQMMDAQFELLINMFTK